MILRGNVFSQALEMSTHIAVLAPNTPVAGQPLPVCYLLHGVSGNCDDMIDNTMLNVFAQKYNCVFVMPEVGRSFYADMAFGQKYFTYVADELPQLCQSVFNISAKWEDTFVCGLSMGGYGALKCALARPERYAACAALSPGMLFLKDFFAELRDNAGDNKFVQMYGEQFVQDLRSAFGAQFDWSEDIELLSLAAKLDGSKHTPRIYMTCGTEDELFGLNEPFAQQMQDMPLDYTFEPTAGKHDWLFFNAALERALRFCLRNHKHI